VSGLQLGRGDRAPVELTHDPRVEGRVRRLVGVSVVALGVIWVLAIATRFPPVVAGMLAAGWALMPVVLAASLARPRLRYLLVLPALLVSGGLVLAVATSLPASGTAAAGWLLITAGVNLGGLLGLWLWYRPIPVPAGLDDPLATGRWALIAVHAGAIVLGIGLVCWTG
jgi:hypothetical protein